MSRSQLPREQLPKLVIPPTAPSTFMLFPKLPREIRNNIWAMAAAESRDIHLRFFHYEPVEQSEPPAILLATHEARSEGKRYYASCQESKLLLRDGEREVTWRGCFTPDEIVGVVRRTIWVNFDVDQLVWITARADRLLSDLRIWARRKYGAGSLKFNFEDEMLSRIQHLKVEWGQDRTWWFWDHLKQPLAKNNVNITFKMNDYGWGHVKEESPLRSEVKHRELEHEEGRILSKILKRTGWKFSSIQVQVKLET